MLGVTCLDDIRHTICYYDYMKVFTWNSDKNKLLKNERNISFEDIIVNINLGNELDIYDHPNKERYPNQKISVVQVEDYVYLVPYVENDEEILHNMQYKWV